MVAAVPQSRVGEAAMLVVAASLALGAFVIIGQACSLFLPFGGLGHLEVAFGCHSYCLVVLHAGKIVVVYLSLYCFPTL